MNVCACFFSLICSLHHLLNSRKHIAHSSAPPFICVHLCVNATGNTTDDTLVFFFWFGLHFVCPAYRWFYNKAHNSARACDTGHRAMAAAYALVLVSAQVARTHTHTTTAQRNCIDFPPNQRTLKKNRTHVPNTYGWVGGLGGELVGVGTKLGQSAACARVVRFIDFRIMRTCKGMHRNSADTTTNTNTETES